jgi:hypothetical protein
MGTIGLSLAESVFPVHEVLPVLTGHRPWPEGPMDRPGAMPMSDAFSKVEIITGVARRRRFTTATKHVNQLRCPTPRALPELCTKISSFTGGNRLPSIL